MSDDGTIERAALGRVASLGDLYDARTDTFCGISMLKNNPPDGAVITQDNNNSDIKFLYDDSLTQKFEKMDISAELRVSVLAGLFTLEGSGKYLSSKRTSNRAVHATMRYNITTQVDRLNLFNDALKECISHDALGHDATHVVVEIQWGANSLLTLKDENRDNEDKTDIEGLLAASLKKALIQISGKADVSYSDGNLDSARSFSFEVLGDLLPKATEKMPAAIDEAVTLMKNLPSLVSSANGGKGKQLKYVLFPISAQSFRNHLATSEIAHAVLRTLEQSSIARCVNLFGEILKFSQEVNDYVQDVKEITRKCACIRREVKDQLESLEREIVVGETRLKGELASTLKDVRSGTKDTSAIDKLREDYMAGESCASKLRSKCEELYKSVGAKIEFAKMCLKLGVKYVTNGSAAENVTVENDHVVIFYASEKSRRDTERWNRNRTAFFAMAKNQTAARESKVAFCFVDCDFDPEAEAVKGSRLEEYRRQKCVNEDMTAENFAEFALTAAAPGGPRLIPFDIRCPGSLTGDCDNWRRKWKCSRCNEMLQYYLTDRHVYCSCTRAPAIKVKLRCNGDHHGVDALSITADMLRVLTPSESSSDIPDPKTHLGILVLGEIGVGKSTFVDGLANYLEFATLDEAQFCGGVFPVPLQFSYDDPASRKSRDILVGANDDLPRPSDRPFVFSFARDGVATSIIDSPGLGRVVENDDSLVRQLLTFASSFQSVDMILLLIHNDQLRLTDTFEHTFNVILRNLHDSALKNVAFCFTNAKLSNYRPGDAFSVLIKQLQSNNWPDAISLGRNNVFCMDNEAIRYLAAVKHGIEHDVEMKKSIESSWNMPKPPHRR